MRFSEVLTPTEVEEHLVRAIEDLEEATRELGERVRAAKSAEAAYKLAFAKAYLTAPGSNMKAREQAALLACEQEYHAFMLAEGLYVAQREACSTLRSVIEALRSLGASVRGNT